MPGQKNRFMRDKTFWRLSLGSKLSVTDEQIDYFREHPDEIDEVTAPMAIHNMFLIAGLILGLLTMAFSKYLKFSGVLDGYSVQSIEFVTDLTFETGNTLVGAGVTAIILGMLLNTQQDNAAKWRKEIRVKIGTADEVTQ